MTCISLSIPGSNSDHSCKKKGGWRRVIVRFNFIVSNMIYIILSIQAIIVTHLQYNLLFPLFSMVHKCYQWLLLRQLNSYSPVIEVKSRLVHF